MDKELDRIADALFANAAANEKIAAAISRSFPPPLTKIRPNRITNFHQIREEFEDMLQFEVYGYDLPTDKPPEPDLNTLVVETKIGDAEPVVESISLLAPDQSVPADKVHREVRGLQDATGTVSLYWLDDATPPNKTGIGRNDIVFADKKATETAPGPVTLTFAREEFEDEPPTT